VPVFKLVNEAGDDRDNIEPGEAVLLIIENDMAFARFLLDTARQKGMKGLVTSMGAAALTLTREFKPDAITLDIHLPDIQGWRVLDRLKCDPAARHVPVCVVSTDDARERAFNSGVLAFVPKPIPSSEVLERLLDFLDQYAARDTKRVLLVDPDDDSRDRIERRLSCSAIQIETLADADELAAALRSGPVDCVVADSRAEQAADVLAAFAAEAGDGLSRLPVVVRSDEGLEGTAWQRLAASCTLREVHSLDRVLDYTTLFAHVGPARLSDEQRQTLRDLHESDRLLSGRKVLIVDDDMRNIFALSTVLEEHDMLIVSADNGRDAVRILQEQRDIDVVLMDIMMPEMDGMETMREIRRHAHLRSLPIVAVTAKAMKGDREKCIEAGAWDYLSKPVDTQQMLAVLRAWIHQ
jgi:CheY-like chemotaxis protein